MPSQLVFARDFVVNRWDGGTTTQLLISPATSSLQLRNFDIRISCAAVEQSGPFSDFSGYERLLLLLRGELLIEHNGERFRLSETSPAWHFVGADKVVATLISPRVDDFNLFVRPGVFKEAVRVDLKAGEIWQQASGTGAQQKNQQRHYGAFLYEGEASCEGEVSHEGVMADDHQLCAASPLILATAPLTLKAKTKVRLVSFSVGGALL